MFSKLLFPSKLNIIRCISTRPAHIPPVSTEITEKVGKFVNRRSEYNAEVTELRKVWQEEIKIRKEREEKTKRAEIERIIVQKAIRLREKRIDSAIRQERSRLQKEESLKNFRFHLAANQIIKDQSSVKQQERYAKLDKDMSIEKDAWLTMENMDKKIVEELFEKHATTGLVDKHSEHWRWYLLSLKLKRFLSPDFNPASGTGSSLSDRLHFRGQAKSAKKIMVQDFLEPIIGTGEERAKYKEIVDKFSTQFEKMDAFEGVNWFFDFALKQNEHQNGEGPAPPPPIYVAEDDKEEENDEEEIVVATSNVVKGDKRKQKIDKNAKDSKNPKNASKKK